MQILTPNLWQEDLQPVDLFKGGKKKKTDALSTARLDARSTQSTVDLCIKQPGHYGTRLPSNSTSKFLNENMY